MPVVDVVLRFRDANRVSLPQCVKIVRLQTNYPCCFPQTVLESTGEQFYLPLSVLNEDGDVVDQS